MIDGVVDTNVLVAGFRSSLGASYRALANVVAIVAIVLTMGVYFAPQCEGQNRPSDSTADPAKKADQLSPLTIPYQIESQWIYANALPPQEQTPPDNKAPEWALVVVGVITFVFIGWQSWETRRAATASQTGAEAALLNAKVLIASERPWLVATIQPFGDVENRYVIRITNQGRTPAELVEAHQIYGMHPMIFQDPPADFQSPFPLPMETFIVNGAGFDVNPNNPLPQT